MSTNHQSIILDQVNKFINSPEISDSVSKLTDKDKKLVVLNNSFLFREKIKTKKNEKYLAFIPNNIPVKNENCFVVKGPNLKSNYSIMGLEDKKIKSKEKLEEAISDELKILGEIIFVLMGEINENTQFVENIEHSEIKKIIYSPKENDNIRIANDAIYLQDIENERENWKNIELQLKSIPNFNNSTLDDLKNKIGKAFDSLKKQAYLNLLIPKSFVKNKSYFLDLIITAMEEQYQVYQENVKKLASTKTDRQNCLNEVLRISYNFVDDATTLIRLIVSVCDLKPIILWETYYYHYQLDESIRLLPWLKQNTKPSLAEYINTIKKARNKSFHRLIPFSKAFEVALPENSIKDANLRIFSEFGSKSYSNKLEYKDKELIDVLMEFTRTSEEIVTVNFWEKNSKVIEATITLLKEISKVIRELR
jgi:hypothetical protein